VLGDVRALRATVVMASASPSAVARADRIYVLDRGRVVEAGTFEELMARGGLLARMAGRHAPGGTGGPL
jgi:ABC-type multidrug transport system fused ATPase/permease subunit